MCRARGKRISGTRLSDNILRHGIFFEESFTIWTIRARAKDGRTRIEKTLLGTNRQTLTTSLGASVRGE
ncbi:hypothetical protein CYLTODRAFT_423505 [Cylindrobasidium torrendii FP15055 ss-10]|uniref:Uncharacterized protein n=1 Tax=Cylindrobasidium torrendii FP15055 ss-10 TaxID=1314674 RepID=A0A0D7B7Z4_9AGAR|nr:hypothetical protein CYLTODRAFT_423505 [Cylindrobasidium torrendii FP15055 ss-10]